MDSPPVAYIVFNRPRHTAESFAALRAERPGELFIIADGPRPDHPDDGDRCREVRAIVDAVDWPCTVHHDYADANLGLKRRVSSGLDWVFEHTERAIILEDDCIPQPDFFAFCSSLLDRFCDEERIAVVTGNNFQGGRWRGAGSYYFSRYPHCWGWATWRSSWRLFDGSLSFWPEWKASADWRRLLPDRLERDYWTTIFDRVHRGEIDSWAYPWTASLWRHRRLTATPNRNLVTNIGFGPDATHTVAEHDQPGLPCTPLGRIRHPARITRHHRADRLVFDHHYGGCWHRLSYRLSAAMRRFAKRMLSRVAKTSARSDNTS